MWDGKMKHRAEIISERENNTSERTKGENMTKVRTYDMGRKLSSGRKQEYREKT